MRYIIVTPAKDEENYIEFVLRSVIAQSLLPDLWIIVNDGSTDNTVTVVQKYADEHSWIKLVNFEDEMEERSYGSKVIRAFYAGYHSADECPYDFIVKLDADLTLPTNYFLEIARAFARDGGLGICGGYIIEREGDSEKKSKQTTYVQGAIKSIRKRCFEEIGGFKPVNGWDGLDQLTALYKGWKIENLPLEVKHHRQETSQYHSLSFFFHNGITAYQMGSDLLLALIRTIVRVPQRPLVVGSLSYFAGYLNSVFCHIPKLVDDDLGNFIRKYHYKRLSAALFGHDWLCYTWR